MIDTFFDYVQYVTVIFPIVPLVISLFRNASKNKPYVYIVVLLIVSMTIDTATVLVLPYFKSKSTTVLLHIYTLSEFIILALFFREIIRNVTVKKSVVPAIVVFILFKIADMIFITGIDKLDGLALTISSFFFTSLSLLFYWQTIKRFEVEAIERYPLFWINSGILLYFAGNLITFIFSNYIAQQGYEYFVTHWLFHNFFNLLKYVAFSIGLWLLPPPQPISLY